MRGLLEKDIRLLLHSKQTFLCFIALVIVLGVTQKNPFIVGYATFMMAAFLVSTLSYDEMDHGLAFLFTLPIDRKMYVREKYLFCMGGAVITWFIALILYFAVLTVNHTQTLFEEEMLKGLAFLPIAILFLSLLLPLQLKFGVEKKPSAGDWCFCFYWYHDLFSGRKSGMLDGESTVILSVFGVIGDIAVDMISLLVAGGMAAVSYLCSCRIMKKKEL